MTGPLRRLCGLLPYRWLLRGLIGLVVVDVVLQYGYWAGKCVNRPAWSSKRVVRQG
jgi:hypothetical protein